MSALTHEDIEVVQTIWCDDFKESLPPLQYGGWLRLYSPDIIAEGDKAGHRKVVQVFNTDKRMTSKDAIRYSSAVTRNVKADRGLDADG